MPRIGQLLSALLVALIGVLVAQMFLIVDMQQRLPTAMRPSATATVAFPTPVSNPALASAPSATVPAPSPPPTLVIIVSADDPVPSDGPERAALADQPARSDGGKAMIERFIELTGKPLGDRPSDQEVDP